MTAVLNGSRAGLEQQRRSKPLSSAWPRKTATGVTSVSVALWLTWSTISLPTLSPTFLNATESSLLRSGMKDHLEGIRFPALRSNRSHRFLHGGGMYLERIAALHGSLLHRTLVPTRPTRRSREVPEQILDGAGWPQRDRL